jgi:hypothetical protein
MTKQHFAALLIAVVITGVRSFAGFCVAMHVAFRAGPTPVADCFLVFLAFPFYFGSFLHPVSLAISNVLFLVVAFIFVNWLLQRRPPNSQ